MIGFSPPNHKIIMYELDGVYYTPEKEEILERIYFNMYNKYNQYKMELYNWLISLSSEQLKLMGLFKMGEMGSKTDYGFYYKARGNRVFLLYRQSHTGRDEFYSYWD